MAENPDHPAHRDQLLTDLGALLLQMQGADKITSKDLMDARLRDPWRKR